MNVKNFRYISILLGLFAAFLLIFLIGLPSGTQQSGSEFLRSDPLIELPYGEYNVELRDALTGIELNKDVYLLSSLSLFKHSGDIYLSGIEDSARIFNEALECENDVSMDLDTQVENNNKVALPVAMGKYFFPRISYVQRSVDGGIEFLGSDFLLELNSCQEYLLQVAESYECLAKQEGVQDYAGSFLQAVLSHALYELVDGRLYFIAQYLSESTKVQDLSAYASLGTCRVDLTQYLSSSEDFLITGEYILALNESRQAPPAFSLSTHHNILSDDLDQEEGKVIVDFRSSQGEPEGVDASVVDVNTGELVARYVRDPLFGSEEGGYCCASLSTSKLKAEWKEEGEPCDGHVVAVITKKEQCFFPSFSDELDPPPSELLPQCCYDPNTDKFEKSNAVAVFAPSEEGMEEYEQQQEAIDTEIKQRESSIRNREKAGKKVSNNEYNDLGDLRDRRNQPLIAGTCESQGKITVGHAAADPCNPASELSCCYYAAWDLYEYGLSQEEYSIADQVQRDGYVNEKQAEIDGMPDGTEDERQDKLNAQYDLDQVKNNPNQTPLVTMVKVCRLGDTIGVPVNKRYCSYGSIPVPSDTDTPYPTYSPSAISSATPYYSYPSPTSSPTQTETYVPYPTYSPSPGSDDNSSGTTITDLLQKLLTNSEFNLASKYLIKELIRYDSFAQSQDLSISDFDNLLIQYLQHYSKQDKSVMFNFYHFVQLIFENYTIGNFTLPQKNLFGELHRLLLNSGVNYDVEYLLANTLDYKESQQLNQIKNQFFAQGVDLSFESLSKQLHFAIYESGVNIDEVFAETLALFRQSELSELDQKQLEALFAFSLLSDSFKSVLSEKLKSLSSTEIETWQTIYQLFERAVNFQSNRLMSHNFKEILVSILESGHIDNKYYTELALSILSSKEYGHLSEYALARLKEKWDSDPEWRVAFLEELSRSPHLSKDSSITELLVRIMTGSSESLKDLRDLGDQIEGFDYKYVNTTMIKLILATQEYSEQATGLSEEDKTMVAYELLNSYLNEDSLLKDKRFAEHLYMSLYIFHLLSTDDKLQDYQKEFFSIAGTIPLMIETSNREKVPLLSEYLSKLLSSILRNKQIINNENLQWVVFVYLSLYPDLTLDLPQDWKIDLGSQLIDSVTNQDLIFHHITLNLQAGTDAGRQEVIRYILSHKSLTFGYLKALVFYLAPRSDLPTEIREHFKTLLTESNLEELKSNHPEVISALVTTVVWAYELADHPDKIEEVRAILEILGVEIDFETVMGQISTTGIPSVQRGLLRLYLDRLSQGIEDLSLDDVMRLFKADYTFTSDELSKIRSKFRTEEGENFLNDNFEDILVEAIQNPAIVEIFNPLFEKNLAKHKEILKLYLDFEIEWPEEWKRLYFENTLQPGLSREDYANSLENFFPEDEFNDEIKQVGLDFWDNQFVNSLRNREAISNIESYPRLMIAVLYGMLDKILAAPEMSWMYDYAEFFDYLISNDELLLKVLFDLLAIDPTGVDGAKFLEECLLVVFQRYAGSVELESKLQEIYEKYKSTIHPYHSLNSYNDFLEKMKEFFINNRYGDMRGMSNKSQLLRNANKIDSRDFDYLIIEPIYDYNRAFKNVNVINSLIEHGMNQDNTIVLLPESAEELYQFLDQLNKSGQKFKTIIIRGHGTQTTTQLTHDSNITVEDLNQRSWDVLEDDGEIITESCSVNSCLSEENFYDNMIEALKRSFGTEVVFGSSRDASSRPPLYSDGEIVSACYTSAYNVYEFVFKDPEGNLVSIIYTDSDNSLGGYAEWPFEIDLNEEFQIRRFSPDTRAVYEPVKLKEFRPDEGHYLLAE